MTPLMSLCLAVMLSLALSTILVQVLSTPLRSLLKQICPTGDAGLWWVAFTSVMLYVAPLFFAVFSLSLNDGVEIAQVVRQALIASLFGAFAALVVVGYKIANTGPQVVGA